MFLYRNLPNIVSILGVLPLIMLFSENGFRYLIPLIVYNNIMDDLDGILAGKLNLRSGFGAALDNVCDVFAHIMLVMALGMHYGGVTSAACMAAATAILIRLVSRVQAPPKTSVGSSTNELMRHMLFLLLIAEYYGFNPLAPLVGLFLVHAVSMLVPYPLPYQIRSRTRSATGIGFVNVSLVVAWLIPITAAPIASCFFATYLYSLISGGFKWRRELKNTDPAGER